MTTIIEPTITSEGTAEHIPIIVAAITGAVTATVGVLQVADVLDPEVAGGINLALTAWIGVGAAWITMRVTARRHV